MHILLISQQRDGVCEQAKDAEAKGLGGETCALGNDVMVPVADGSPSIGQDTIYELDADARTLTKSGWCGQGRRCLRRWLSQALPTWPSARP